MYYYEVAPTRIIRHGVDVFTYASAKPQSIGQIVRIPVGKSDHVGVVIRETKKPSYATKSIDNAIIESPLPKSLVSLALWMSQYYRTPLATTLQTVLPRGITKKRRKKSTNNTSRSSQRTHFVLNKEQQSVLKKLDNSRGTFVLHGITGSGKTAVYIEKAKRVLNAGHSVIVLVPEIALTSQLVAEFSTHFDDVLLTHSRQTEAERHLIWQDALTSTTPRVVIGPRSALFLPLASIGLIIIDECHEPSFQQEQSPRYSALRVASHYVQLLDALAVFGSATPLVSDYYLADKHDRILRLPSRAMESVQEPTVTLVDMTKRTSFTRHRFLSNHLLDQLEQTFARGEQALLFHNRRGSASTTLCENCGWQAGCPRCFVPLTLHADKHILQCHICNTKSKVPTSCPVCQHANIVHKGVGTKLIESELRKLFPKQTIARFDGDTNDTETVDQQYKKLVDGSIDLIIGTQVIAKGLHLPKLRLVGVVQADSGLSLPDYSSPERTFQLLTQVIGRVGRNEHATEVIIQSYQPNHSVIQHSLTQNYSDFYTSALALRRHASFPPFTYLLKLSCTYKTEQTTIKHTQTLAKTLSDAFDDITILGPTPAFYERVRDTYRWQLVVKSQTRQRLIDVLEYIPKDHWQFELDPLSLL